MEKAKRFESTEEQPRLASCFWCETEHPAAHPLSVCPACAEIYREKRFPLGALEMGGPFRLDDQVIDDMVGETSAGSGALGDMPSRSARYGASARAAWGSQRRACRSYDDLGGSVALDDTARPSSAP